MDDDKGGGGRAGLGEPETDEERLSRNRGHLQDDLVNLWNTCDRGGCNQHFRYHPGRGINWSRFSHDACPEFVAPALDSYLYLIASWDVKHKPHKAFDVEPSGVVIKYVQRRGMYPEERRLARDLKLELPSVAEVEQAARARRR